MKRRISIFVPPAAFLLLCIVITIWVSCHRSSRPALVLHPRLGIDPASEEAEVQRVVQVCQVHERLGINVHPQVSCAYRLEEFWLPSGMGGRSIERVRNRLQNLISHGWHHGEEARSFQFEFRYARVKGDVAEVGTREKWYLPVYDKRDQRVRGMNPDYGPYSADYTLRKVGRRWLLATDTVSRPLTADNPRDRHQHLTVPVRRAR